MGHKRQDLRETPMEGRVFHVMLKKDTRIISQAVCIDSPIQLPSSWNIIDIKSTSKFSLNGLPRFHLRPACADEHQKTEWGKFTKYLQKWDKAALVHFGLSKFYILPTSDCQLAVCYDEKANHAYEALKTTPKVLKTDRKETVVGCRESSIPKTEICGVVPSGKVALTACGDAKMLVPSRGGGAPGAVMAEETGDSSAQGFPPKPRTKELKQDDFVKINYARADPSYLKTLGQAHSGWIFGAIAELIDNARDAKASTLEIAIETIYSRKAGKEIPVLSVIDDGLGMSHEEICRMLSFGGKTPDEDDRDRIGRFGIGFKTGAMRIGQDAIVLTQTSESRSIGFLSQSLNEGKKNLEIPIVSYCRMGSVMEVDTSVQSVATNEYHLKVIKEFSPFNEYLIGEKLALFRNKNTGTQIYIWNLDEYGSNYCLEWENRESPHLGDIQIRSRRVRLRPGQISQKVSLDYSLRSYLEVIFLDPRMKIFVQGSLVKSRPLAKSLNNTTIINGDVLGKPVQLTLGRSQLGWEEMNCGIFLYWHGRLIEAYKRVGGMVHNADMGRGVIGVIDVSAVMDNGKHVFVLNNKQGFEDSEVYAKLEEWLGQKTDEYWDINFDTLQLKNCDERYEADHEWVQCSGCRKWRILSSGYDSSTLPREWFCCMPPYNGSCQTPEEEVEKNVITVGVRRESEKQGNDVWRRTQLIDVDSDVSSQTTEQEQEQVAAPTPPPVLKRLRRGNVKVNLR